MSRPYLEVTYRAGKALAAYLYLDRRAGDRAARTVPASAGLLIDHAPDGRAIGIEITSPSTVTADALNAALASASHPPATPADLAPLKLAS
ncbi:MAG TPA: hypothetical protein VK324_04390 [Tepidisphaeraceae bacterium]|nr:hypothetical protein [Tepidisphaeraceae bacterium]